MRTIVALFGVAAGAALAAGCASRPPAPCGPQPVWIPPRVESKTCYEMAPARTREKTVKDLGLCRDERTVPTCLPIRERVEVPTTATALVPAYRRTYVPETGYVEVQDYGDRLCPKYECRCVPTPQQVTKVSVAVGFNVCSGPTFHADVCRECRIVGVPTAVRTGEQLVSLPSGTHLEQVPVGCKCVPLHVGADRMPCVTGTHHEERIVGYAQDVAVVDNGLKVRERGEWRVRQATLPAQMRVVEKRCLVPGFWAIVVDEAPAVRKPGVITRAEYEELMKDVQRSHR